MNSENKCDAWQTQASVAGVSADLAQLGRGVIRDYWEHGHYRDELAGEGPYLGADRHHAMMIALALQKPDLAKAVFEFVLGDGSPQEDQLLQELGDAERRYADLTIACGTPDWYARVYALDGCVWDLYTEPDHQLLCDRETASQT
jgi:hypothetical protein